MLTQIEDINKFLESQPKGMREYIKKYLDKYKGEPIYIISYPEFKKIKENKYE